MASTKSPLLDVNTPQNFYVAWNSLFKQGTAGSNDTVYGMGINRMYWLDQYLLNLPQVTFQQLIDISLRQYLACSGTPLDNTDPDEDADLFTILFKECFFQAVQNNPTPDRLKAIAFLESYTGNWFDGSLNHILNGSDVSDQKMLSAVWLNLVAQEILNPFITGTSLEVAASTAGNPLPTFNNQGNYNDMVGPGNTLSRILGLACDNTVFFNGWLTDQPSVDQIIVTALDFGLNNVLGGFAAQPWGKGLRGVYQFFNASPNLPNPVRSMKMCNVSGCYLVAEFRAR